MAIFQSVLQRVGDTPMVSISIDELPRLEVLAKLEYLNPTGSVKDRAASFVIDECLQRGTIDQQTTVIESSSGNMGIALSAYCRSRGLRFICVIDPHISPINEMLIRSYGADVVKVVDKDPYGGYLLTRIAKVQQLRRNLENCYWVNQYANPLNARAYYHSLAAEICADATPLDYIFLGISSGGTITGVSQRVKECFPAARVIAVDIVGSVIFGGPPRRRLIPGIGSSMVPEILKEAKIDDVVMMDELSTIRSCHELLQRFNIFAGGSSGSVYGAVKKYFNTKRLSRERRVVTVFPDRGERYFNTIYDPEWMESFEPQANEKCHDMESVS